MRGLKPFRVMLHCANADLILSRLSITDAELSLVRQQPNQFHDILSISLKQSINRQSRATKVKLTG